MYYVKPFPEMKIIPRMSQKFRYFFPLILELSKMRWPWCSYCAVSDDNDIIQKQSTKSALKSFYTYSKEASFIKKNVVNNASIKHWMTSAKNVFPTQQPQKFEQKHLTSNKLSKIYRFFVYSFNKFHYTSNQYKSLFLFCSNFFRILL